MSTRVPIIKNPLGWFLGALVVLSIVYIVLSLMHRVAQLEGQLDKADSQIESMTTQKQGIPGVDGEDGESAYEIAVRLGFAGTEAEWLASLKGDTGAAGTNGKNGTNGANGSPGGYSTVDIQCIGNHWKLVVNSAVTRDLGVYCF